MTLMQNTLKHKMPFSNVLITCQSRRKHKNTKDFCSGFIDLHRRMYFFHPAGVVTRVFVVPRKVTGKRIGGGDARIEID